MSESSKYSINLKAIDSPQADFQWDLDDDFFAALDQELIERGCIHVALRVKKTSGAYNLQFQVDGEVTVPCDRCLDPMQQPIHGAHELRVVLGDCFDDDGELITVPEAEGTVDLAWNIYEIVALLIPTSHTHAEGQCNTDMAQRLQQYTAGNQPDARWEALRALTDNNK